MKTGASARTVGITPELANGLRQHATQALAASQAARRDSAWVFATATGRPLSQRNVQRELRRAQANARRPDGSSTFPELHEPHAPPRGTVPSLHGFRHAMASWALHDGDTADDVAAQLGHKSANVTRAIYLHEMNEARRWQIQAEKMARRQAAERG